MRIAKYSLALLATALLLSACNSVSSPTPDSAGDAAFVTAVQQLCTKTPALTELFAGTPRGKLGAQAKADVQALDTFGRGTLAEIATLSNASPLAPTVTDLQQLLTDLEIHDTSIVKAAQLLGGTRHDTPGMLALRPKLVAAIKQAKSTLRDVPALTRIRLTEAREDLTRIGVKGCPR